MRNTSVTISSTLLTLSLSLTKIDGKSQILVGPISHLMTLSPNLNVEPTNQHVWFSINFNQS